MIAKPEIAVTPDYPVVKFREPRETVDLDLELPRILQAQGWGLGTVFRVQFITHERTKLRAGATFVVTEDSESIQTSEANPNQPMTRMVNLRACAQIGPWWESEASAAAAPADIKWNPGKRAYDLIRGGVVVATIADKAEAQAAADRAA